VPAGPRIEDVAGCKRQQPPSRIEVGRSQRPRKARETRGPKAAKAAASPPAAQTGAGGRAQEGRGTLGVKTGGGPAARSTSIAAWVGSPRSARSRTVRTKGKAARLAYALSTRRPPARRTVGPR
jgi:hypothetical protein